MDLKQTCTQACGPGCIDVGLLLCERALEKRRRSVGARCAFTTSCGGNVAGASSLCHGALHRAPLLYRIACCMHKLTCGTRSPRVAPQHTARSGVRWLPYGTAIPAAQDDGWEHAAASAASSPDLSCSRTLMIRDTRNHMQMPISPRAWTAAMPGTCRGCIRL